MKILPSCNNTVRYNAAFAGAATAALQLDGLFSPIPEPVHWALAGYAADKFCDGQTTLLSGEGAVWGVGGAMMYLLARSFI
jgi:hypothetical protein